MMIEKRSGFTAATERPTAITALRISAVVQVLFLLSLGVNSRAQDLAITRATVYGAPDTAAQADMTVIIRHGVIAGVGRHLRIPRHVEIIYCRGCVVLAGFWNAHVHFTEPKWDNAASQPAEKLQRQMVEMVTHSGFTTVVDTGSDGENTQALRRRLETGEVSGPRILTAGIPLYPAHALPYYLADLPADVKSKMAQPETAADAAKVVEQHRVAGYDIVKLFTGSIVSPNHVTPMHVSIARAAVNEAHRYGQLVFSHSSNVEGTKVAIDAGVDVLAHTPEETTGIGESLLKSMIAQHITIIPTLKLFSRDGNIASIRELDYRFHQLGGRLVYGTDTGFLSDYGQTEEFCQLTKAGFGFRDVLAMLTTAPVELFHLSRVEGKVVEGMRADLTILSEDPASGDPAAFTKVRYTIRDGKVIWRSN